jgi:hypothetical protein
MANGKNYGRNFVRVVDGVEVESSNNFDKLQNKCDKEMDGHVLSAADYYAIRLNMMDELKKAGSLD